MLRDLIFFYFFISYSTGIVALVFSLYLCRGRKSGLYTKYFFIVLSLFLVIVSGTVSNYFNWNQDTVRIFHILQFIMYLCPCMLVYLLPDFYNDLYLAPFKKPFRIISAVISAGLVIMLIVLWIFKLKSVIHLIIMSFLGAATVYSVVTSFIWFRKPLTEPFFSFLKQITVLGAVFLPLFIFIDFYPLKAIEPLDVKGPLSLPLFYAIWNIIFIVRALKFIMSRKSILPEVPQLFLDRYNISNRESEVLKLLLNGLSYREIMEKLFISMPTVKTHVSNIYKKTGAGSKMKLANQLRDEV